MELFLDLIRFGDFKAQQQIALKLHKAFPDESRFLDWTLLSMIFQLPNRCNGHSKPSNPLLLSIAHRCLQTLLDQKLKLIKNHHHQSSGFEDPNEFWIVLKVLEIVGAFSPEVDHSKILGIGKLKYPEKLFEPSSTPPTHQTSAGSLINIEPVTQATGNLSLGGSSHPIECRRPELPEYISLVREDYFRICDSKLGQKMRMAYLNLELLWRERAVGWANSAGLKELAERMKKSLSSDDHNWNTMITLNQSVVKLIRANELATNEFKLLDDFYDQLDAKQSRLKNPERGYCLARIDLRCRLRDPLLSKLPDDLASFSGNLDVVIYSYLKQFGEKKCCFSDLAPYLKLLTTQEADQLTENLQQYCRKLETNSKSLLSETSLRQQINAEQILRAIRSIPSTNQIEEASKLMSQYFKYLPLGDDLPSTALQPSDDLSILAAQTLIQDWQEPGGRIENLYAAAYILETCLAKSVRQYQARSLLIRLHRLLGNLPRNLTLFTGFGIKQIQHDTLSHLGLDRCSIFFNPLPDQDEDDRRNHSMSSLDLINYPASIYQSIEADTLTWIENCYVSENYIKVEDFQFFHRQIQLSLQKKISRIERIRLQLFEKTRSMLISSAKQDRSPLGQDETEAESSVWNLEEVTGYLSQVLLDCQSASDNRDFTIFADYQPEASKGTCDQTSLGPMLGNRWVWVIGTIYARVINPKVGAPEHPALHQPDFFSECSAHEIELYEYSKNLIDLKTCTKRDLADSLGQKLVEYFQRRKDEVEGLMRAFDKSHTPADLLVIIHSVYEAFCLFALVDGQHASSSPSLPKNNVLIFKATKARIVAQIRSFKLALQKLLDALDLRQRDDPATPPLACLFASPHLKFPWGAEAGQEFASLAHWNAYLANLYEGQRLTIAGWLDLIKLIAPA